jgi:hypothetical protein
MTIKAVRIFSVMFVIRGFVQVAQYNHMALGRKKYAFIISAFDGFVGIVPLVYLLSRWWGVDGLWLAYPLCALLIVVGIFAYNFVAQRRLSHKMSPFLFVPSEKFKNDVLDISIHGNMEKAGVVTRMVLDFCDEYGIDSQIEDILFTNNHYTVYTKSKIYEDIYDAFVDCIQYLPTHLRIVMMERYINRKKVDDIANENHMAKTNVKNWLRKGGECLMDEMKCRYPDLLDIYNDMKIKQ